MKINITAFRGCKCILYCLVKLITEFLGFQKAIKTIFISFSNSRLHFDNFFDKIQNFAKKSFTVKLM